ncbi:MAG: shikimate dehydrogenase [Actinomycetota bacterium]|nr:shikimate dehydrogenase [Actinomycetota bacterium]
MKPPTKLAIIGDPVAESLSPAIHSAALSSLGLGLQYEAMRVPVSCLNDFFAELRARYLGLNVTRPLKEIVIDLCDEVSSEAAQAGSVNTVAFKDGRAYGASTDVCGFMPAIRTVTSRDFSVAVILGTGGVARAAALALRREGARVHVAGRNELAGRRLAADLNVSFGSISAPSTHSALERADLLVNATPLGGGATATESPLPDDAPLPPQGAVFDLVYRPRITRLLQRARDEGCVTIDGLRLLVEQAALSLQIWTGRQGPRQVMRAAALGALNERGLEPEPFQAMQGRGI